MNYPNLNLMLHAANRRLLMTGFIRAFFLGLVAVATGVLVALVLDAIFAFPVWALVTLDLALVIIIFRASSRLIHVMREHRFEPRRIARSLEDQLAIGDNKLINSIDLRERRTAGASRSLLAASIESGETAAQSIDVAKAIESKPARRALGLAFVVAIALFAVYWALPELFARGIPRLVDPTGDHPPFTLVKFDVTIEPQPIYHGGSASIDVRLGGPQIPEQADLVFFDPPREVGQPLAYERMPLIHIDDSYSVVIDRVETSRRFYVDTPLGRSNWFDLEVLQAPLIQEVWATYRYPDYTDWAGKRRPLNDDEIRAIVGTEVTLEVTSNLPLGNTKFAILPPAFDISETASDASVNDNPELEESLDEVVMVPDSEDPRRVRGSFVLKQSGRCRITLMGSNGEPGPEQRDVRLIALPDEPPEVSILDPERMVYAVEGWKLPVVAEADDDVQLQDLPQLNYSINDGKAEAVDMAASDDPGAIESRRRMRGVHELDLEQLQAKPGDEIRMFASAADNRPGEQQSADSQTHVVRVISLEEYEDYLRELYDLEQMQQEIKDLREALDGLAEARRQQHEQIESLQQELAERQASGQPADESLKQQLNDAQRASRDFQRQLDELEQQLQERLDMPQLYENEHAYREQLDELATKLQQESQVAEDVQQGLEEIGQSSDAGTPPSKEQLDQLSDAIEKMKQAGEAGGAEDQQQLQQQEQLTEKINMANDMLSQTSRIQQVMEQQREVADRMKPLEDKQELTGDEQQRADRLARQQEHLNQELEEAVDQLREAAERAEAELPKTANDATQLCDAIAEQAIPGDQRQAAQSARSGNGQEAEQSADRAADKLEALAQGSCPNPGTASGEIDSGLGLSQQSLQKMLEQMGQAPSLSPSMSGQRGQQMGQGTSGGAMGDGTERANAPRSEFGLRGPRPPMDSFGRRRRGAETRDPSSTAEGDLQRDDMVVPEMIRADDRSGQRNTAGRLRGVPVRYRDQAEAYFRRLAEEP